MKTKRYVLILYQYEDSDSPFARVHDLGTVDTTFRSDAAALAIAREWAEQHSAWLKHLVIDPTAPLQVPHPDTFLWRTATEAKETWWPSQQSWASADGIHPAAQLAEVQP